MKIISFLLIFTFFLIGTINKLQAQSPRTTFQSTSHTKASAMTESMANVLPPKQVILLHEIIDISEADMIDDPDNPEIDIQEDKLMDQVFQLNLVLHLFATSNIAKIHVKIGTSPGAADHAAYRFVFDQEKGLPAPFTYTREGDKVELGMGEVRGINLFYVEVVLQGLDGKLSEPSYYYP